METGAPRPPGAPPGKRAVLTSPASARRRPPGARPVDSQNAPKLGWCWAGNPQTWLGMVSAGAREHAVCLKGPRLAIHRVMQIEPVPFDHPDAGLLTARVQLEYVERYGGPDETPLTPGDFSPPHGLFLIGYLDETPVASGGWRTRGPDAELKRMYVVPEARGRGLSKLILAELERTARAAGRRRVILETGDRQPEAIALYRASGYTDVERFGIYADTAEGVYLGKPLEADAFADLGVAISGRHAGTNDDRRRCADDSDPLR